MNSCALSCGRNTGHRSRRPSTRCQRDFPMNGQALQFRAAAFHDADFDPDILSYGGGFSPPAPTADPAQKWWADKDPATWPSTRSWTTSMSQQDARRIFLAMCGSCLYDIGASIPHPDYPHDTSRQLTNNLAACLFVQRTSQGLGVSTVLKMLSNMYNSRLSVVGHLENESAGCTTHHASSSLLVTAPDVDANFDLSHQLDDMLAGKFMQAVDFCQRICACMCMRRKVRKVVVLDVQTHACAFLARPPHQRHPCGWLIVDC